MIIIFLDIDGVLNCQQAYELGYCKYADLDHKEHDHYQTFYPSSKNYLNELIDDFDAKIVISSAWRNSGLEWLKKVWKAEEMSGEIIDITPSYWDDRFSVPRGCEIESWLEKKKGFSHINWDYKTQEEYMIRSGIENYLIIDDDSDMLYSQRKNFVHVEPAPRNLAGFHSGHLKKAKKILNKNIVELIYG